MDPELTHDQLAAAFPDFGVLTFEDDAIPGAITHPTARRVLSVLGIPRTLTDMIILNPRIARPDSSGTMAEVYKGPHRPTFDRLIYLGMLGQRFVALDGESGDVLALEEDVHATLLASDLYRFSAFLYLIQKEIEEISPDTTETDLADMEDRLITQFSSIDQNSVAASEELWRDTIKDIIAELD